MLSNLIESVTVILIVPASPFANVLAVIEELFRYKEPALIVIFAAFPTLVLSVLRNPFSIFMESFASNIKSLPALNLSDGLRSGSPKVNPAKSNLSAFKTKSCPAARLPLLLIVAPFLLSPYCKPKGILTCNKGGAWGLVALNSLSSENLMLLAVLALNEPAISNFASAPKIIPLGLIKYKFVDPLVFNVPSIFEIFEPVTRPITFVVCSTLSK